MRLELLCTSKKSLHSKAALHLSMLSMKIMIRIILTSLPTCTMAPVWLLATLIMMDYRIFILQEMKFKDITASSGADGGKGWDNGVTMVDINNDGLLDIYVCKGGFEDTDDERRNLLYVNKGNQIFKDEAKSYGLDDDG